MIQYLTGKEKINCRELWEEAFPEDSREFGDYYFQEKVKDNQILALIEENEEELEIQEVSEGRREILPSQVQAMLHRNPYRLMVRGKQWQADYLVGVATRETRRHRGYMRRLLQRMMEDMHQEKMPFCFLMPADEAIYRPFGFTFIYRQPWFEKREGEYPLRGERIIPQKDSENGENTGSEKMTSAPVSLAAAAAWMNQWLDKHYQVYAVRDEAYLERLAKELLSEEGTLDVFFDNGEIVAMESWWGREKPERRLLYGEEPYVTKSDKEEKPAIMARIISPKEFVRGIRLRESDRELLISLRIQDPLIQENDGYWLWHLNQETSWLEPMTSEKPAELTLKIEDLTSWLFGYQVPEAAGRFAPLVETLDPVFLDEVV